MALSTKLLDDCKVPSSPLPSQGPSLQPCLSLPLWPEVDVKHATAGGGVQAGPVPQCRLGDLPGLTLAWCWSGVVPGGSIRW
jgi:hypothetical protein